MNEPEPTYPVTPLTVFAIRWWAIIAVVYGGLICLGGRDRWTSPSYFALRLIPGSPYTLGVIIIAAGSLILAGSFRLNRNLRNVGMWLMAAWCSVLGAGFAIAAARDEHVSLGISVLFVATIGHVISLTKTDERRPA